MFSGPFTRRMMTGVLGAAILFPVAAFVPGHSAESIQQSDLRRIEAYLNSISSLDARFTQLAPDGGVTEGRLYLRRPGRARFEYAAPSPVLVVIDGTWIVFHDKELKQTNRVPLFESPLSLLLDEKVSLEKATKIQILSVEKNAGTLRIKIKDRNNPGEGELTLLFASDPFDLKQWVIRDPQGFETQITLSQSMTNTYLRPELFVFYEDNQPKGRGQR